MNRLFDLRMMRKMSQRRLARLTGISQPRISMLENGLRPTFKEIKAITRALGLADDESEKE